MHSFFDLVGYEYKKILKRKSVWVMLVLDVLIAVVTCGGVLIGDLYEDGVAFESQYEGMVKDRSYAIFYEFDCNNILSVYAYLWL